MYGSLYFIPTELHLYIALCILYNIRLFLQLSIKNPQNNKCSSNEKVITAQDNLWMVTISIHENDAQGFLLALPTINTLLPQCK